MKKIWSFITNIKNQRIVLLIAFAIFIAFFLKQCDSSNKLSTNNAVLKQNTEYYKDSLKIAKNKVGDLQYERAVLLTTHKKLKEDSSALAEEIKNQKGHVIFLNNTIIQLKNQGPVIIENEVTKYPDGIFGLTWKHERGDLLNFRILAGESKFSISDSGVVIPGTTILQKDEIGLSLYTGLVEKDGVLNIFVKSTYPGFTVTNLDGAIIDPKKSGVLKAIMPKYKWGIGPTFSTGLMYNPVSKTVGPYIGVGVGITRRITKQDIKNIFIKND